MIVFSATVTLALEHRRVGGANPQIIEAIQKGMQMLEQVESQNKLAEEASRMLNELRPVPLYTAPSSTTLRQPA
jgi:hypothetical protein